MKKWIIFFAIYYSSLCVYKTYFEADQMAPSLDSIFGQKGIKNIFADRLVINCTLIKQVDLIISFSQHATFFLTFLIELFNRSSELIVI